MRRVLSASQAERRGFDPRLPLHSFFGANSATNDHAAAGGAWLGSQIDNLSGTDEQKRAGDLPRGQTE